MTVPSDKEETKRLRDARVAEKRQAKDMNKVGKRLEWARLKLGLTQRQVSEATGIPASSYCGREAGVRTDFVEEYLVLSAILDREWQAKFTAGYPTYGGDEVTKITPSWLMFGADELLKNAETLVKEFQIKLQEIERDAYEQASLLRHQLSLFAPKEIE